MPGFQKTINQQQAPAVAGDFASADPRATVLAGEGALITGPLGVIVGRFAWAAAGIAKNSYQAASQIGFVHRELQALITDWLGQATMLVPGGLPITLFSEGAFWGLFAAGATPGQKVYASYADGTLRAGATGAPATNTGTVSTATNSVLTVTTAPAAPIVVGQPVSGAGIQAGTVIASLGTGTGGLGTYNLSLPTTATASGVTATFTTDVETAWTVRGNYASAAGELAKITTWGA